MNIKNFHVHVYFDDGTRGTAERIRDALTRRFDVKIRGQANRPSGPHAKPMFQVTITPEQFADVVPWLMLHRDGLSVLVHPTTEDWIADHDTYPLWMGQVLPVDVDVIRRHLASRAQNESTNRSFQEEDSQ